MITTALDSPVNTEFLSLPCIRGFPSIVLPEIIFSVLDTSPVVTTVKRNVQAQIPSKLPLTNFSNSHGQVKLYVGY